MKINVNNKKLPGVQSERVPGILNEQERHTVYDADGKGVGDVVYVRRKIEGGGSHYGWRPAASMNRGKLLDKVDAVRMLLPS